MITVLLFFALGLILIAKVMDNSTRQLASAAVIPCVLGVVWTSNSYELKELKSDLVDFHRAQYFLYFGGELQC